MTTHPHEGSPVLITCDESIYRGCHGRVVSKNEYRSGTYYGIEMAGTRCSRDKPVVISMLESDLTLEKRED